MSARSTRRDAQKERVEMFIDPGPAKLTLPKKTLPQLVFFSPLILNLIVYKTAIWRRKEYKLCESTLQTISCHIKKNISI